MQVFEYLSEVKLQKHPFAKLVDAAAERNYLELTTGLREHKGAFSISESVSLCSWAIRGGCDLQMFQTILAHCAPLQEIMPYSELGTRVIPFSWGLGGLVQEAAANGNVPVLAYLLEQGFSPNRKNSGYCSALEAALWGGTPEMVAFLLGREDVDASVNETMLALWGSLGQDEQRDACFRLAAGRFVEDWDATMQEIPLLPGLTVYHAAAQRNWPLVIRMCREGRIDEKEGVTVLEQYMNRDKGWISWDASQSAELLDVLFTQRPALLRYELPRFALTVCMLVGEESVQNLLRPWVEKLPGRMVTLSGYYMGEWSEELFCGLPAWKERMGTRLRPVLRRDKAFSVYAIARPVDEYIRMLMKHCEIRGTTPTGKLSQLAKAVLEDASAELVRELCEEGKLFPQEDLTALLERCDAMGQKEKRDILLVYNKKNVDYEL